MAYMNTSVTRGRAEMIVTTTGMGTEMGSIAHLLNKTEVDRTPLQKQLDRLTMIIAGLAGLAFVLMVILGFKQRAAPGRHIHRRCGASCGCYPHRTAGRGHSDVFHGYVCVGRPERDPSNGCPRWRRWAPCRRSARIKPVR